jgi:6-phosphogluconolactonase
MMKTQQIGSPPCEIRSFRSAADLAKAVARDWLEQFQVLELAGREPSVALSGGRIAETFLQASQQSFKAHRALLQGAHFFWADERCVPPDHRDSNYGLASKCLLKPMGVPEEHIHRIPGEFGPELAATTSVRGLRKWTSAEEGETPVFDLVFLGMGEDGHVASLFPNEPEDRANSIDLFRAVESPKPPKARVTMGYGVLSQAEEVWVLASGEGKLDAFKRSIRSPEETPLGRVLVSRRSTRIYTDLCPADTFAG